MTPWEQQQRQRGLADLHWHWDGAYAFAWDDGKFTATRADDGAVITAGTLLDLKLAVQHDYAARPVPRDLP